MRHIKKCSVPQFFIADTAGLTSWDDYFPNKKNILKKHILEEEQFNLCCYCEIKVNKNSSHMEHIKPKHLDVANLTFKYENLLVSCNGYCLIENKIQNINICGHRKLGEYDDDKFLNPVLETDISNYFEFNYEGKILPSNKNPIKASYTITTLNLNGKNNKLAEARKKAKDAVITSLSALPIDMAKLKLQNLLNNDNTEFITFFRYVFQQ